MPAANALYSIGITANMVTVSAIVLSLVYGLLLLAFPASSLVLLGLPLLLFVRMALNAVDGMLARQFQQQSNLGAMLNEVGDIISDTALYIPFAFLEGVNTLLVIAVVFLSLVTEFVGILGQVVANSRRYDGPMGKSDRAFVFGAIALLMGVGVVIVPYLNVIFSAMCVLLAWCAWNRAQMALRLARNSAR